MRQALIGIRKFAIFCHRWMGLAFCVLFAWWFASGIFIMYWDFPSVRAEDRLQRAPALDASRVRLSAAEALAAQHIAQTPSRIRLTVFDGRPMYHLRSGRNERAVYADSGGDRKSVV